MPPAVEVYCRNYWTKGKTPHILFHYILSQDIEYSSLCYIVGPCLFICSLYNSLHLLISNSESIPLPQPQATTSLFSMTVSLFVM